MRRCESCNRPLRDPESLQRGYGPGCWAALTHIERAAVRHRLAMEAETVGEPAHRAWARPSTSAAGATDAADAGPVVRSGRVASVLSAAPAPEPCPPERSDSALAVAAAWIVGLLTLLGLLLFWQWVLLGIGVVTGMAVTGLLIERVQERRQAVEPAPGLVRSVAREAEDIATAVGSRTVPTTPSGAM
jgi:hypothetical protein